jgi:hypothetical protein
MQMEQAAQSLRTFALDLLSQIHAVTNSTTATQEDIQRTLGMFIKSKHETIVHVL